jgi:hypothetical protein
MIRGVRGKITSAHVIATIALFAALGGGYAVAFSGTGSLQKAAVDGLPESFVDVRSLTGFGALQARCDVAQNQTEIRFHNSSSSVVEMRGEIVPGDASSGRSYTVAPGEESSALELSGGEAGVAEARFHLYRSFETTSKAQVDLTIAAQRPGVGVGDPVDCDNSAVRILALNTQQ